MFRYIPIKKILNTILKDSPFVIFLLDADGCFLVSEGKSLARFGIEAGQIVGETVYGLYRDSHPEYIQHFLQCLYEDSFHVKTTIYGTGENKQAFKTLYIRVEKGKEVFVLGMALDIFEEADEIEDLNRALNFKGILLDQHIEATTDSITAVRKLKKRKLVYVAKIIAYMLGFSSVCYQILRFWFEFNLIGLFE
jgi:hypothetical protein